MRTKAQSAGYGLLRRSLIRLVAVGRDSIDFMNGNLIDIENISVKDIKDYKLLGDVI